MIVTFLSCLVHVYNDVHGCILSLAVVMVRAICHEFVLVYAFQSVYDLLCSETGIATCCVMWMGSTARKSCIPTHPQIVHIHTIESLSCVGEDLVGWMDLHWSCRVHASHNTPCMALLPDEGLLHSSSTAHNNNKQQWPSSHERAACWS